MGKRKVITLNTSKNSTKESDINNNHIQTKTQESNVNANKSKERLFKNIEQGRFDDP